jgi:hypothetical protein
MLVRRTALLATVLALLVAVPVVLAAAPAGGTKYRGKTSAGEPVSLRLNGNAHRVKRLRISYTLTCGNGSKSYTYTDILNVRLRKDYSFAASGKYTGSADGSRNSFSLSGKVRPKKASGKFSLTSARGKLKCKTGKLTWSAKRVK